MWLEELICSNHEDRSVSLERICEILINEYGAKRLETKDIPSLKVHRFNALYCAKNESRGLKEKEICIKGILLPITEQTKKYTEGNYVYERIGPYLVYEEQIGYCYSNSERLFLEVMIALGVTEEDIENNTEEYNIWKKRCVRYWGISGIKVGDIEKWKTIYRMELE